MEMEMEMVMTMYIPYDITVRILSRLPVNSLLRLRWACKYWLDLITRDPEFVKMHLHHSLLSSYPCVLISSFINDTYIKEFLQCHITDITKCNLSDQVKILDPFDSPEYFQPLGTCHGLLFFRFAGNLRFYIWNPCTKEYKLLPNPPLLPRPADRIYIGDEKNIFGFGYDSSIDDYIVVRNSFYYTRSDVQVYRLRTNTWTSIEPKYPYDLLPRHHKISPEELARNYYTHGGHATQMYGEGGVFFNGALYWIDSCDNSSYKYYKIISFDMVKETYQELSEQPECCDGNVRHLQLMRLQLFEGSLCLLNIDDTFFEQYVEMWVMKDYSVNNNNNNNNNNQESSWTKLFKIKYQYDGHVRVIALRLTNNGEILALVNWTDFVLFDPKKSKVRTLNLTLREGRKFVAEVYTESFVSLNSGTYVGQED